MASDKTNDEFDDELLSAYVDDELTAEERAAVEERLRSDLDAARLVDELRAMSKTLKAMPRESLGYELGPAVEATVDRKRIAVARHTVDPDGPPIADRGFKRGFAWATIAVAATLMLAFVAEEERPAVREVAKVEPQRRQSADGAGRPLGEMRAPPQRDDAARGGGDAAIRAPSSPPALATTVEEDSGDQSNVELYAESETPGGSEREGAETRRSMAPAAAVVERLESARTEPATTTTLAAPPAPALRAGDAMAQYSLAEPDTADSAPEVTFVELVTEAPDPLQQLTLTLQARGIAVEDQAEASTADVDLLVESETAHGHLATSQDQGGQDEAERVEPRGGNDRAASTQNVDRETGWEFAAHEGVLIEGSPESVSEVLDEFVPRKQPWISEVRVHREGRRIIAGVPFRGAPADGYGYYRSTDAGGFGGAAGGPQPLADSAPVETPAAEGPSSGSKKGAAQLQASSGVAGQEAKQTLARARRLQINELTDPALQSFGRSSALGVNNRRQKDQTPQEAQLIIYFTKPSDTGRSAAPAK